MRTILTIVLTLAAGCQQAASPPIPAPSGSPTEVVSEPRDTPTKAPAAGPPEAPVGVAGVAPGAMPPIQGDYLWERPRIHGLEDALKFRETLADGRDTPVDIGRFLDSVAHCREERIPRHAQMMSCTYKLKEELAALNRKYRRDKAVLAVLENLEMW